MRVGLWIVLGTAVACGTPRQDTPADTLTAVPRPTEALPQAAASAATATARSATKVLIVGTSLTAGYGLDNPDDAYPSVMQRTADSSGYKVSIQNAGLSGETSAGALRRVDWLLREPFDVVVIETGANDGLRGLDVDSTRANLTRIVQQVKRALPRAKVALVQMEAPPNLGDRYTNRFRENFQEVASAEGVTLLPFLLDGVAGVARLNQRDGIHPNPEGARKVATNLWRGVEPLLR